MGQARKKLTTPGGEEARPLRQAHRHEYSRWQGRHLRVLLAIDLEAVSDVQLLMGELQAGNPYHLEIAGIAREGTVVYQDAVEKGADVVLLSPTIPGYSPEVVQRLYHYEEHPILTVALVPTVGDWAVTMEKAGAMGHLTTPLSPESISRLAAMLPPAVRDAYAYRTSDKYVPRLSPEVAQIVDRGGWRRQTVAFWAPSGGVGKTTLSVNVAAALGVIANKRTLLIDTDMNKEPALSEAEGRRPPAAGPGGGGWEGVRWPSNWSPSET